MRDVKTTTGAIEALIIKASRPASQRNVSQDLQRQFIYGESLPKLVLHCVGLVRMGIDRQVVWRGTRNSNAPSVSAIRVRIDVAFSNRYDLTTYSKRKPCLQFQTTIVGRSLRSQSRPRRMAGLARPNSGRRDVADDRPGICVIDDVADRH